jgi:hypothetical protein
VSWIAALVPLAGYHAVLDHPEVDMTTAGTLDFMITIEVVVDGGDELVRESLLTTSVTVHVGPNETGAL